MELFSVDSPLGEGGREGALELEGEVFIQGLGGHTLIFHPAVDERDLFQEFFESLASGVPVRKQLGV